MLEIEDRYLVSNESFEVLKKRIDQKPKEIIQGYFDTNKGTVRIRIQDDESFLTIKTPKIEGVREEFEYAIPYNDAHNMFKNLCDRSVNKLRYEVIHSGNIWTIDVFKQQHEGLIIAEIELDFKHQTYQIPGWCGRNITNEVIYSNSELAYL